MQVIQMRNARRLHLLLKIDEIKRASSAQKVPLAHLEKIP